MITTTRAGPKAADEMPAETPFGLFSDEIWREVHAERVRAHRKHQDTSMEQTPVDSPQRLTILVEEVGEVARVFNEARHAGTMTLGHLDDLRSELIQVAAMAGAWADAIGTTIRRAEETP